MNPLRTHGWDKGMLNAYRFYKPASYMPYDRIKAPVQFILGDKEPPLVKIHAKNVGLLPHSNSERFIGFQGDLWFDSCGCPLSIGLGSCIL